MLWLLSYIMNNTLHGVLLEENDGQRSDVMQPDEKFQSLITRFYSSINNVMLFNRLYLLNVVEVSSFFNT